MNTCTHKIIFQLGFVHTYANDRFVCEDVRSVKSNIRGQLTLVLVTMGGGPGVISGQTATKTHTI